MSDTELAAGGSGGAEEDIALPKATVAKLIQEYLPEGFTCAKDAKDLMADCCKEFVLSLAAEANEIVEKDSKKTMMPEHIVMALKALGFDSFVPETEALASSHKETTKATATKKKAKLGGGGLSPEELLKKQEELFAASRARMEGGSGSGTAGEGEGQGEAKKEEEA